MRLAILADIHGNIQALQAVAASLEKIQPDAVIIVGDIINAVPFSSEVIDFIRQTDWVAIRGNHEFYYLDFVGGRSPASWRNQERWGQLHWLIKHMRPEQGDYLAALPDELTLYYPAAEPLRVTHGTPGNNRGGFSNSMAEEKIADALISVSQKTYINAHSHVQIDRMITEQPNNVEGRGSDPSFYFEEKDQPPPRKWHIINPGSVGLPLNGDPRAQFAIIENKPKSSILGGWRVRHYRVPYDRRPALEAFADSGMLEEGGVISELFYWELVTAQREIPYFFIWKRTNLTPGQYSFRAEFEAYKQATGRDAYIRNKYPFSII